MHEDSRATDESSNRAQRLAGSAAATCCSAASAFGRRGDAGIRTRWRRPRSGAAQRPHPPGRQAEHPRHLRRRHRPDQRQRLFVRPDGLPHAEHRPHRPGRHDVHRLLRRAELHGGAVVVHHRPMHAAHRPFEGRHSRRDRGSAGERRDDRRIAQAARLRHRPVRQEPSRRPQRISADGARLRRVLRQSLPPQRRRGSGEPRTYPRDPAFRQAIGPRGVLRCKASDRDDPTEQPRWGKVGKQTIEDTGPLTKKRMETIDDETSAAAIDFMQASGRRPTRRSSAGSTPPACISAPMCGNPIATSRD